MLLPLVGAVAAELQLEAQDPGNVKYVFNSHSSSYRPHINNSKHYASQCNQQSSRVFKLKKTVAVV